MPEGLFQSCSFYKPIKEKCSMVTWKEQKPKSRQTEVQILTLPYTRCLTLASSVPSVCKMRTIPPTYWVTHGWVKYPVWCLAQRVGVSERDQ